MFLFVGMVLSSSSALLSFPLFFWPGGISDEEDTDDEIERSVSFFVFNPLRAIHT